MSRRGDPPPGRAGAAASGHADSAQQRMGVSREDTEALLGARHELGREYEPALVDAFLDSVDDAIDARVQARVDAHMARKPKRTGSAAAVPIFSLIFAIPLSAISGGVAGLPGLVLAWAAIVLVNLAHAVRRAR